MNLFKTLSLTPMAAAFLATSVSAAVVDTLGTEEFADGSTPAFSAFTGNVNGDSSPFNTFSGSDISNSSFGDISFTHNFNVVVGATSASLRLSLFDIDSFSPASDTIDILFDGVQQDVSAFLGTSIPQSSVNIATLDVDLAFIADGMLDVQILGQVVVIGAGDFQIGNGLGVDFSELSISTDVAPVPLPASGLFLLGGLGLLASRRKRKA